MPKLAELQKPVGYSRHLYFHPARTYRDIKAARYEGKILHNHGADVFIWDGEHLPVNPDDPRTKQILNCTSCVEDIRIQNRQ